ncbi:MAG: hypothetical protein ACYC2K_03655 [Gemmatimonadales bacterium]
MHAFAVPNHIAIYKPKHQLTEEMHRNLAFIDALAWGADRAYRELVADLEKAGMPVPEGLRPPNVAE